VKLDCIFVEHNLHEMICTRDKVAGSLSHSKAVVQSVQSLFISFNVPSLQSVERARAVNALVGWEVGCDPHAKPEELMYYRAVMEGMPAMDGGERSDPKMFFGKDTNNYLMYWHTKRMSSTRGEFSGCQGYPWAVYRIDTLRPSRANGEEKVKEQKELGRKLLKGKAENLDRRSL
jgi:hypothetical protein